MYLFKVFFPIVRSLVGSFIEDSLRMTNKIGFGLANRLDRSIPPIAEYFSENIKLLLFILHEIPIVRASIPLLGTVNTIDNYLQNAKSSFPSRLFLLVQDFFEQIFYLCFLSFVLRSWLIHAQALFFFSVLFFLLTCFFEHAPLPDYILVALS